jgi:hypothetical protein
VGAVATSSFAAKGDLLVGTGAGTLVAQTVGANGTVLTADSTQADGVKWAAPTSSGVFTNRSTETASVAINQIAYNGSNLWVAVGASGYLATSTNGTTWTSRTSGFGANSITSVAFGNGLWVAVGAAGTLTTSTDGTTWTARTSNMSTNQINHVIYANGYFVAVGAGGGSTNTGGIISSTDGLTWTRKSQTLTVGDTYGCVNWNGTNWQVGAVLSTNNTLSAGSDPQGTWTAALSNLFPTREIVAIWNEGGNVFYAATQEVGIGYVSGLISATSVTIAGAQVGGATWDRTSAVKSAMIFNNRFYSTFGLYSFNFGTTVFGSGANGVARTQTVLNPTADGVAAGFQARQTVMWVGTTGMIIGGTSGNIYTNF